MSIYNSVFGLGDNPWADTPLERLPRAYQKSHVYPSIEHPPAMLDTASIPHWCIPGHNLDGPAVTCATCGDECDGDITGQAPWLRLSIGDATGDHTVVLPADGVRALRDHLTRWLGYVHEEAEDANARTT